jgi:hypothetical protein
MLQPSFTDFNLLEPEAFSVAALLSNISMDDIAIIMEENPSFRGYIQGYLAEKALREKLQSLCAVSSVKVPDRNVVGVDSQGGALGVAPLLDQRAERLNCDDVTELGAGQAP